MTSVNDVRERSPRGVFGQNFTTPQGVEGVKIEVFRKYPISHMENLNPLSAVGFDGL